MVGKAIGKICVAMLVLALVGACSQSPLPQTASTGQSVGAGHTDDPQQVALWKEENHAGVDALSKSDFAAAERHLKAALDIAEKFGARDVRLGGTLLNLASAYESEKKLDEAETAARQSVSIFLDAAGAGSPVTAAALVQLARINADKGNFADAAKFYEQAVAIMDKNGDSSSDETQTVLQAYAQALEKSGQASKAKLVRSRVTSSH